MGQNFYSSEEIDHMLVGIESNQRREVLLCIDEILSALDTASPAMDQWRAARRSIQLIEGKKFAAMAGISVGAMHGESAQSGS